MLHNLEYKNPWFTPGGASSQMYSRHQARVWQSGCGKGSVVKVFDKSYDYLVFGRIVSQRAGRSMGILNELIKCVLDRDYDDCMYADRARWAYDHA